MKRKELEKLPVLRATTAMLKQAENEPMISEARRAASVAVSPMVAAIRRDAGNVKNCASARRAGIWFQWTAGIT